MAAKKTRLDHRLVELGLAKSRERAKALIMAGKVRLDNQVVDKPGTPVTADCKPILTGDDLPYVSRGGLKLAHALEAFQVDASGNVCLDVGASTGGFTDCLLQHGARRVYAVDVGYGQLAWSLRQDQRVVVIERTNIRHMPPGAIPEPIDLVSIDVSFISLRIVVPEVVKFIRPGARILALIKPQFEVGRGKVGKGGVVRDPRLQKETIRELTRFFEAAGLRAGPAVPSPILGPKGNREFLISLLYRHF